MSISVQYPYPVRYLRLPDGCDVAYVDEGAGPYTLLFVHGLATYAMSWQKNIEGLKQHFRCIAIDLPGNGLSGKGDYPYSMSYFAATVHEMITRLQLQHVVLAGHSMGGQIAITTLLHYPGIAEKLVLCAPAGFEVFTAMEKAMYHTTLNFFDLFSNEENSLRQTIRSSFYNIPSQGDSMIAQLVGIMKSYPVRMYRSMIDACIQSMLQEPVYNHMFRIQQPVLAMFGERDALIPNRLIHPVTTRQVGLAGVSQFPDARLEMIPQCGHFVQWEKAEEVNALIRKFILE
jgi:pimeloyl-ACP methyl ester carboxylesterase